MSAATDETTTPSTMPLNAFNILHGLHDTPTLEKRRAARARWVWAGATLVGALVCWAIVADHFALSREVDATVSSFVSQSASQNAVVNHAIHIAGEAHTITGGFLLALVWWCWFAESKAPRERLVLGFGAVLVTAVLSRLLQVSLPVRLRPMHDLASGFLPLPGMDPTLAHHWGSFPSDHAALYFALVTVVWQRSRWLGLLALISALYGVLPRIYLGLHYASDVAAGAVLGVAVVLLFERFGPRTLAQRALDWEQRVPGVFYGAAFLLSLEAATLFNDIRQMGRGIPAVLKQLTVLSLSGG